MKEFHTPGPWEYTESTEDFQGHFILGNDRTIAATFTEDACKVTRRDFANCILIVAAPTMLKALRQIASEADFDHEDGAMALGQRLISIEQFARGALGFYDGPLFVRQQRRNP